MNRQPLSYQQQNNSCWITSMFNAFMYLLDDCEEIPMNLGRFIFSLSGDSGIENEYAEALLTVINSSPIPVVGEILKGKEVGETRLLSRIRGAGTVLVCDTMNGGHSILVTKTRDNYLDVFDPYWDFIISEPKSKPGQFERLPDGPQTNAMVHRRTFFSTRFIDEERTPFTMGRIGDRFAVVLTSILT